MQSMNQVTVSSDQQVVSIGPGNRWGNVYKPLDDLSLAMVGGRVTEVGVGGLVLGSKETRFSRICPANMSRWNIIFLRPVWFRVR